MLVLMVACGANGLGDGAADAEPIADVDATAQQDAVGDASVGDASVRDASVGDASIRDVGPVSCDQQEIGPDDDIFEIEGERIKYESGFVYLCVDGSWVYVQDMRGPWFGRFTVEKDGDDCTMTAVSDGTTQTFVGNFSDDFEDLIDIYDLFAVERWNTLLMQSPLANTIPETNALASSIMQGGSFLDNRVEVVTNIVHSGTQALKFTAVAPDPGEVSKAMLEKRNLCYTKGDDFWHSGWYYSEGANPSTVGDLESMEITFSPGPRVYINDNGYALVELKFADKPKYTQQVALWPTHQWVHLKLHYRLSQQDDGLIEMWIDDTQVLSVSGRNLPLHDSVLHRFSLGITATDEHTVLYVDDIQLSRHPL
ncbi:MAG: heparin lyase I family protein [Deltaproteobacteria bacterium]|nr:heparin lyase I family protein [Deltaproteobacteria bacterium]